MGEARRQGLSLNLGDFATLKKGPNVETEQWNEFQSLSTEAARRLDDGDWVLRLSARPSFDDWRVLGVRREKRRVEVVGRRWRRGEDAAKFRTPEERMRWPRGLTPTIDERSAVVADRTVEDVFSALDGVVLPIARMSGAIGLDGVSYAVCRRDALIGMELRWWEGHPTAWRPLMAWFAVSWRRLEGAIGSQGSAAMEFAWERAG